MDEINLQYLQFFVDDKAKVLPLYYRTIWFDVICKTWFTQLEFWNLNALYSIV